MQERVNRQKIVLLAALTLAWGINWPVMKAGVAELPPLYFRAMCMFGGLACIAVYARWTGVSLYVPRAQWREVAVLALPNMVIWHLTVVIALKLLPAGRSAILAYTMPAWAVVIGLLVFGVRTPTRQWWGVAAALLGTALLLSSEFRRLTGSPLGTLLMLGAAAFWGLGTNMMRRYQGSLNTLTLTFWMLMLTVPPLLIGSTLFESTAWRAPNAIEWGSIVYNMVIAIGFCHIAWFQIARALPPAASGLSVMMIPVVGVLSSMALLGEQPRWQDYVALVLIMGAVATAIMPGRVPTEVKVAPGEGPLDSSPEK